MPFGTEQCLQSKTTHRRWWHRRCTAVVLPNFFGKVYTPTKNLKKSWNHVALDRRIQEHSLGAVLKYIHIQVNWPVYFPSRKTNNDMDGWISRWSKKQSLCVLWSWQGVRSDQLWLYTQIQCIYIYIFIYYILSKWTRSHVALFDFSDVPLSHLSSEGGCGEDSLVPWSEEKAARWTWALVDKSNRIPWVRTPYSFGVDTFGCWSTLKGEPCLHWSGLQPILVEPRGRGSYQSFGEYMHIYI